MTRPAPDASTPAFRASTLAAAALAGLSILAAPPVSGQSVEDFEAAPHRSSLVAAGRAPRIAWVENRDGVRNVWTAAAPGWSARRITGFSGDDGRTIRGLRLLADGSAAVFTRGDPRNRHGDFPNPTSLVEEPFQRIHVVATGSGGAGRVVGPGSSPLPSPDGTRLVFRRDGKVWIAPLDGDGGPVVLFADRGGAGDLTWSPDGLRLAFSSDRGHHAFVGIVEVPPGLPAPARERADEGDRIRWIAPSVDRNAEPVWSPDGDRLAFLRFAGPPADPARRIFGRVSEPFSVVVGDPETGEITEVWRSPRDGSNRGFPRVSGDHGLEWAGNDRLVFPAELDGWLHMYAVPADGGEPVDLITGECIAEDAVVGPGGEWLYYNHNCGDVDRRHLSRVRVDGTGREGLTRGETLEWSPTPVADGSTLAFIRSSWDHPGSVFRMPATGGEARAVGAVAPERFPRDRMAEPRQAVFTTPDGYEIHGQLFLPPDARDGDPERAHPAMIYMHGGSRRQMLLGFHYSGYYHNAYAFNQYLASRGYVVLSVNYRSGIGYGKAFRQPPHYGWQGAAEYRDIVAAARWLAGRREVDPGRIGLWGGSYGGYLTALGLARDSDVFAAGVDLHGVHDWVETLRFWGSGLFDPVGSEPVDSLVQLAYRSSPDAYVDEWRSPVLLIHGDDDRNVDFRETVRLVELLRERGHVEPEQLVFPDDVHGFLLHSNWMTAFRRADAFLEGHLRPGEGR